MLYPGDCREPGGQSSTGPGTLPALGNSLHIIFYFVCLNAAFCPFQRDGKLFISFSSFIYRVPLDRCYLHQPSCIRSAEKAHRKGHKCFGVFVHAVYCAAVPVFLYEAQKGSPDLQGKRSESRYRRRSRIM